MIFSRIFNFEKKKKKEKEKNARKYVIHINIIHISIGPELFPLPKKLTLEKKGHLVFGLFYFALTNHFVVTGSVTVKHGQSQPNMKELKN